MRSRAGSESIHCNARVYELRRRGFEPVLREDDDEPPLGREPEARPASELPADLQRIVERLTRKRGVSEPRD